MSGDFEIIVGTYEQFLLGYKIHQVKDELKLERSFATHSHQSSIRSVSSRKHYLASAGADDLVSLYDMRPRVESGRLAHHNGTINVIEFTPDASHLLTGSSDGSISIVRCGNWQLEKHWQKAHKGFPVNTLAIHPSGKIALSAGGDGVLRTWNLIKGRPAYATNLVPRMKLQAKHISVIKWSPNGEMYLVAANCMIDVYFVETAGIVNEIKFDSKVICADFLNDDKIVVGHENGQVTLYDIKNSTNIFQVTVHDSRVKCISTHGRFLVTASSSGKITLWKILKRKLNLLASVKCGARITCLTLALPCEDVRIKTDEITEVTNTGD
ncbi:p21-activated protein kinase-interacting protein 1-like [Orussus abietinus]|uniref:p21-activated protein kinase-interacting protein 1-like n=1 Tax=Orussus abietinus TaxID=222816 RepID=UPI00062641A4|nr:p21-activated protein kinase-interacting protein 1-like [Orussus abietinus]